MLMRLHSQYHLDGPHTASKIKRCYITLVSEKPTRV